MSFYLNGNKSLEVFNHTFHMSNKILFDFLKQQPDSKFGIMGKSDITFGFFMFPGRVGFRMHKKQGLFPQFSYFS